GLAFTLALSELFHFAFIGSAGDTGCALLLGGHFLARGAPEFLTFQLVFYVLCIHSSSVIPAYLATIFCSPCPGKLIVSFASSPSPSRRNTVPRPYLGC